MDAFVNTCELFFLLCLISQICSGTELSKTFRCHSTEKYIHDSDYCDGSRDCSDREDEDYGCRRSYCGKEKFTCGSACHNITARCNTIVDCEDGADEKHCGDEINVTNCTSVEKFLCRDGLRCLDLEYTCDGYCNCFDCSDENSNCSIHDENLQRKCLHAYFPTVNGPQCFCNSDDRNMNQLCKNVEICTGSSSCDQRCIKFKDKVQCSCYVGYHAVNGTRGAECRNDAWYATGILYATFLRIKFLNITTNKSTILQSDVHSCTALSGSSKYFYYATLLPNNKGSIFKSSVNTTMKSESFIETDLPVTSIAVDYISNNVYFTSNGTLSVCTGDGRICTKLKCCGINYVSLAPKSGWMFYLQAHFIDSQNVTLVKKSNMDGSDETTFVDDMYKGNVSIFVDELQNQLYLLAFVSAKAKIERISFDVEIKEVMTVRGIRSVSVFDNDIFFIMDQKNIILRAKKFSKLNNINEDSDTYFRDNTTSTTKYLFVYNSILQRSRENPCSKSQCAGLCLLKPAQSSNFILNYTCVCDNFTPSSNNHWCSTNPTVAANGGTFLVVLCFLLFAIFGVVGIAVYYRLPMENFRNWYRYFESIRSWRRVKRGQRLDMTEQEE